MIRAAMVRGAAAAMLIAGGMLAAALPGLAHGPEERAMVSMQFQAFSPPQTTVLAGDPVTWTNSSPRPHTVTARDGRFDSGMVQPHAAHVERFTVIGNSPYFCRIHPAMTGSVDVRALLLTGPPGVVVSGSQVELAGRAVPGLGPVTIQEDRGSGFQATSSATVTAGRFHALVHPRSSATYRAVAGSHVSPPVRVVVGPGIALSARRGRGRRRVRLAVTAPAAPPGATVVLQAYLKERFGWWPVGRRRLDGRSGAQFSVRPSGRRLRAVLTEPDGVTVRGVSNVVRIRRGRR